MPSRLKKRRKGGNVELNMAAMLDMAFQLLTFFILTFRPAPVEGQVMLRLPPPKGIIPINGGQAAGENANNDAPLEAVKTLTISVYSKADGSLGQMAIGETSVGSLAAFDRNLKEVFGDEGTAFEQIVVQVGGKLQYDGLMQVIDVCGHQQRPNGERITKLSFVEAPE